MKRYRYKIHKLFHYLNIRYFHMHSEFRLIHSLDTYDPFRYITTSDGTPAHNNCHNDYRRDPYLVDNCGIGFLKRKYKKGSHIICDSKIYDPSHAIKFDNNHQVTKRFDALFAKDATPAVIVIMFYETESEKSNRFVTVMSLKRGKNND